MLKPRLIGLVLVRDGLAVQSIAFRRYLPLGQPEIAVEYLDRWGADEIILLDIAATRDGRAASPAMVARCAAVCRTPLTVGGGIADVAGAAAVLAAGADKVCVNTAAHDDPNLVSRLASRFGNQCVVVAFDVVGTRPNWHLLLAGGRRPSPLALDHALSSAQANGAGEILVNSIDRDGGRRGFDLELIRHCASQIAVPLIAAGGAGHPSHLGEALASGATAVAAGNMLHYTEHSVILAKRHMQLAGVAMRMDSPASYPHAGFLPSGRLAMTDEARLQTGRFDRLPPDPA